MMVPVITDNTIKNVNDISNTAHPVLPREQDMKQYMSNRTY